MTGAGTVRQLVELAQRGISHAESAEREADYGIPTFGPTMSEELAAQLDALHEPLAVLYALLSGKTAHASDCATSCAPAELPSPCDCTVEQGA